MSFWLEIVVNDYRKYKFKLNQSVSWMCRPSLSQADVGAGGQSSGQEDNVSLPASPCLTLPLGSQHRAFSRGALKMKDAHLYEIFSNFGGILGSQTTWRGLQREDRAELPAVITTSTCPCVRSPARLWVAETDSSLASSCLGHPSAAILWSLCSQFRDAGAPKGDTAHSCSIQHLNVNQWVRTRADFRQVFWKKAWPSSVSQQYLVAVIPLRSHLCLAVATAQPPPALPRSPWHLLFASRCGG